MANNKIIVSIISFGVILIIATVLMSTMTHIFTLHKNQIIREQFEALVQEVYDRCVEDMITVHENDDWNNDYDEYIQHLSAYAEIIDNRDTIFAAIYDPQLHIITQRFHNDTYIDTPFNPLLYPEFIDAVKNNTENGILLVNQVLIKNKLTVHQPVDVYFRIVPFDDIENYVIFVAAKPRITDNVVVHTYFSTIIYAAFIMLAISMGVFIFSHQELIKNIKRRWGA